MRVVVGLGNPGSEYQETRHNAGFLVLDAAARALNMRFRRPLLRRYQIAAGYSPDGTRAVFVKPQTFMNLSGIVLRSILHRYRVSAEDLVVVCDQLDLDTGAVRIKRGGGDGGHRGLRSVSEAIGSDGYVRLYLGIDKPPRKADVVGHVLGVPEGLQRVRFAEGIDRASRAVIRLLDGSVEEAMNEFNRRNGQSH